MLSVIAEARGRNEDNELQANFYRLLTGGTSYVQAERFRRLTCPLSFRRKQDNIVGIQLAVLCAYPVARKMLRPAVENRPYDIIAPKFYRGGRVIGLKWFP